jgi:chemotaxis protein histidine kinase CheA
MSTPPALLAFFRQEAGEYLDRLDQLMATDTADAPDAATFLAQSRALRGAASMTKLTGLPELASTMERIAGGLRDGELRWDQRLHFAVRGALASLRALTEHAEHWSDEHSRSARTSSVALAAVAAGYLSSLAPAASPASPVVPIARLFPEDGAPGIVQRNPEPPITLAERFRTDLAAAADGVDREAANLATGERGTQQLALTDALRRTLLGLSDVADSYGASSIAGLAMRMARSSMQPPAERVAIQAFARLLMDRELSDHELAARVREHGTTWPGTDVTPSARPAIGAGEQRATPAAASAVQAVSMRPTIINAPVISATPVRQTASIAAATPTAAAPSPYATPTAAAASPYATPATTAVATPAQSNDIVPIESLLYDGNAALQRARAVRDELRAAWQRAGGTSLDPTTASLIDELSDLLDLAVAR